VNPSHLDHVFLRVPEDRNYDHFAVVVEDSIDEGKATLDAAGVAVERELTPRGATGTVPAVYVRDPFGYQVELRTTVPES
jgi:catechol 2,3-dioxygenase-like lactoylglutathione lyase family enzyme